MDPALEKLIEESTKLDKSYFVKATLDQSKFETPVADPNDHPIDNIDKKYTKKARMNSQQDLELK